MEEALLQDCKVPTQSTVREVEGRNMVFESVIVKGSTQRQRYIFSRIGVVGRNRTGRPLPVIHNLISSFRIPRGTVEGRGYRTF